MGSVITRVALAPLPDVAGAASLTIEGPVTLEGHKALRTRILGAVSETPATRLVLELGAVGEIDTSGAALLAEAFLEARKRGVRVLFCRPSASVMRLFELAGFQDVLDACCAGPAQVRERLLA